MPQLNLTAAPSAGDTVTTDKGWTYEYNGTYWFSKGKDDLIAASGEGPFVPAITDPASVTITANQSITNLPWFRGNNNQTNVFTNNNATTGGWVIVDDVTSTGTLNDRSMYIIINNVTDPTWAPSTLPTSTGSTFSNNFDAFNLYQTAGAYDMTNDVTTASASSKRVLGVDRAARQISGTSVNAASYRIDGTAATGDAALENVDQFVFTLSSIASAAAWNNTLNGDTFDVRRGDLQSTGYWAKASTGVGSTTAITGSAHWKVAVYDMTFVYTDN